MRELGFKTKNRHIQAWQDTNSFGDQIITITDLKLPINHDKQVEVTCDEDIYKNLDQTIKDKTIVKNIEVEGCWVEFSEKNIKNMIKDMQIKL